MTSHRAEKYNRAGKIITNRSKMTYVQLYHAWQQRTTDGTPIGEPPMAGYAQADSGEDLV